MFDSFTDFHFLRPWWLLLLLAAPLFLVLQNRIAQRTNNWHRVIAAPLFDALVGPNKSKFVHVATFTMPIALICAAVALAGPTYEKLPQPIETKDDPLVIVLDLSMSMTSEDLKPSRVERAKFKIADVLRQREEGITALVVYAGDAYIVTPLTSDDQNILNLLPSLHPTMMPVKGSNTIAAVTLANQQFESFELPYGEILLLTDGISNFAALRGVVDARFPISILGVGSGSGIDERGRELAMNEGLLRDFARITGGRYQTISHMDDDISFLLAGSKSDTTQALDNQTFDVWHDVGYLLILPLALLLAITMRRSGIAVLMIVVAVQVDAGWLEDLWVSKDQQGFKAHQQGDFEQAADLFEDPSWRGVAEYRQDEFETAIELFAHEDSLRSIYNQATALAWLGNFQEALNAYDLVLESEPEHEDALHNKQILEQLLENLQNQQSNDSQSGDQNQPQDGDQDQESQSQSSQSQDQNSDSSESEQNQQQSEAGTSEQNQNAEHSESEEEEQHQRTGQQNENESSQAATAEGVESDEARELKEIQEAWLRRIPDDPGGILRRKFEAESNARIDRGELDRNEVGSAW